VDDHTLTLRARERFEHGLLPVNDPAQTWAGPGLGKACALCDRTIDGSETEYELLFGAEEPTLRFHRGCHGVWDRERVSRSISARVPPGTQA
jgi:hypothetical protein